MGCHLSRKHDADSNPRIFKVFNVDDQWNELSSGRIEITDLDLILYQRGKEPIRWPLRSLRRYGFDAELFSFESGRRCPTGPGIYAFKCRRAEALFNLLQESIQRAGQEEQQHRTTMVDDTTGSRPSSLVVIQQGGDNSSLPGQYVNPVPRSNPAGGDSHSLPHSPHHYVNGDIALGNGHSRSALLLPGNQAHEYVNTAVAVPPGNVEHRSGSVDMSAVQLIYSQSNSPQTVTRNNSDGHVIQYAVLDLPSSQGEVGNKDWVSQNAPCHPTVSQNGKVLMVDLASSQATYVNVPAAESNKSDVLGGAIGGSNYRATRASSGSLGQIGGRKATIQQQMSHEDQHSYANLDLVPTTNGPPQVKPINPEARMHKVNYIQLDLKSSTDNLANGPVPPASPISLASSNPESPSRRTESYATIDFHKTAALSNSVKSSRDDGFRKTRHNSNIEELN